MLWKSQNRFRAKLSTPIPVKFIKTSRSERASLTGNICNRFPHHLYGFLTPHESFSAADYERLVSDLISDVVSRKKLPLLVGGTGFYMKAVLRGVWPVTAKSELLRVRLRQIEKRHGKQFLHNMLMRFDPASAASIAPQGYLQDHPRIWKFFFKPEFGGLTFQRIKKNVSRHSSIMSIRHDKCFMRVFKKERR